MIYYETERGGQVFFIHNRVKGLAEMKSFIQGLCPTWASLMPMAKWKAMNWKTPSSISWIKYDVLVCTNIVESGVDIPNVNTIIVNNAHQFGLSDLHQFVAVWEEAIKSILLPACPTDEHTLPDSRKRLNTWNNTATWAVDSRLPCVTSISAAPVTCWAANKVGFIAEIGFEMYQKILDEAIRELKRKEFKDLFKEEIRQQDDFVTDCSIDTDLEILIPDNYVESITERLSLYSRLDNQWNRKRIAGFSYRTQWPFRCRTAAGGRICYNRKRKTCWPWFWKKLFLKTIHWSVSS